MDANEPIYTVTLGDFEERLEVEGVRLERLGAGDVERLRDVYAYDEGAQWKQFESIAIAAQSFASQVAEGESAPDDCGGDGDGDLSPLTPRWLWDAMLDAGNASSPRLGPKGELIITAYSENPESGGCGDLIGDFVVTCEPLDVGDGRTGSALRDRRSCRVSTES